MSRGPALSLWSRRKQCRCELNQCHALRVQCLSPFDEESFRGRSQLIAHATYGVMPQVYLTAHDLWTDTVVERLVQDEPSPSRERCLERREPGAGPIRDNPLAGAT